MADQGNVPAPELLIKLPVGPTVLQSLHFVWLNRRSLAPWPVAAVAFYVLTSSLFFYGNAADFTAMSPAARYVLFGIVILGFIAVAACLLVAIVVTHRRVLLVDGQALRNSLPPWRAVVRYVVYALLISLLPLLGVALAIFFWVSLVGKAVADNPTVAGVIFAAYFLVAFWVAAWVIVRLCLVLPAKASDVSGFGFESAWRAAKGNALRLAVGALLVSLPFVPWFVEITRKERWGQTVRTEYVFRGVLGEPLSRFGMPDLGLSILSFAVDAIVAVCLATFFSHAFRILRHNARELPNPDAG